MRRIDLLDQLLDAAGDGAQLLQPGSWREELTAVCRAGRVAFGAAAVSIARVDDDGLRYEAADGVGADEIVGVELPLGRGLGGLVAATGQALVVDDPSADPRFGRDVAERTGYVPSSMLVVPVHAEDGMVAGVLSVLDRTVGAADALELGSAFARIAAHPLANGPRAEAAGRALLQSVLAARADGSADLAAAVRRATRRDDRAGETVEVAELVALLGDLRRLDDDTRREVVDVVERVVALARGASPR